MKPASLLLLLASVLSSQLRPSAGRPLLLGSGAAAGDRTASALLRFLLREDPEAPRLLPAEEEAAAAARRSRSEEPPLSIDLTFHLLRNMIRIAQVESQRERALLNRRVLDEVGK